MRLEAVIPKTGLLKGDMNRALRQAVDEVRKPVEADLNAVTRTWKTQVRFRARFSQEGGSLVVYVSTTNKIFMYVDQGTQAHIIRPKKAKLLSFRTGFVAKTQPGVLSSGQGSTGTGSFVSTKQVNHPGTKARRFTELIARKHQPALEAAIRRAIQRITG